MRQTSFAAATMRPIATDLYRRMVPPATSTLAEARAIAVDMTDAGILDRAEAFTLAGFASEREWNQAARQRRLWRKMRTS
jgi:hypothetical protein